MITVSRVTRNSDNADTLRNACEAAILDGRSVEIIEEYTAGDWWTTFKIEWPDNQRLMVVDQALQLPDEEQLRKILSRQ